MKIQLIVEILVLCALLAFASARVIDSNSFDSQEFTSRLISNVTKGTKNRQNEIVVGGPDYDDPIGSGEISVGEEDVLATNNVPTNPIVSPVVSVEENNSVALESEITESPVNIDDAHPLNRYCTCNEQECNCCREFKLPLVSVRGPGCASLRYLGKNRMSIAIKYGDITLTSRTISGRKARPVCLGLPGGFSQFCGRVYGINREADDFQACLGLELRAEDEVEAALRVSCFKFGPKGLKMTDAQPLPPVAESADDDDEDGDGILGLVTGTGGNGDDDDEEYDDDEEEGTGQNTSGDEDADLLGFADDDEDDDGDDDDDEEEELDDDDDDDDAVAPAADYPSGFSLLDGIFGDSAANKKKKPVQTRNKVNSVAEDVKLNQVGTKVKIANSPGILSSAALSQNEIDNTITKDTAPVIAATATKLDPVNLDPAPVTTIETGAKPIVEAIAKPLAEEKPKPVVSSVVTGLESNAGVPLVSTTPKPKKKQSTSILDTIESLIAGDDDDDDEEEEAEKEDEPEDDDEDEEEEEETEKEEEEEEEEPEEDDEEEEEAEKEEEPEEDEEEEDEDEETVADDATKLTNDKESVSAEGGDDKKKTKKKNDFGLGFFARLMKLI